MTPNQLARLITSLQYRKRMSLAIDDLESEVIAFLTTKGCLDKPDRFLLVQAKRNMNLIGQILE